MVVNNDSDAMMMKTSEGADVDLVTVVLAQGLGVVVLGLWRRVGGGRPALRF